MVYLMQGKTPFSLKTLHFGVAICIKQFLIRILDGNGNHKTDKLKSKRFMKNLNSAEVLLDYRKNMRYNLQVRCFVVTYIYFTPSTSFSMNMSIMRRRKR